MFTTAYRFTLQPACVDGRVTDGAVVDSMAPGPGGRLSDPDLADKLALQLRMLLPEIPV